MSEIGHFQFALIQYSLFILLDLLHEQWTYLLLKETYLQNFQFFLEYSFQKKAIEP